MLCLLMTERIIDLSDQAAHVRTGNGLLVIERPEAEPFTAPLGEVAVLVVSHPCVTLTHAALACLSESGGAFVACDARHMPVGMMLPLAGHHVQAERFATQARAAAPQKKHLWQQIVRAKVAAQGRLLQRLRGADSGLLAMSRRVRSGDAGNIEAQAARRYWPALFKDPRFSRDPDGAAQNVYLNYGYAVLRATVGRAICASGLHPSLGIHHHNRYDAFCLADDLMEPFRPLVDQAVALWVDEHGSAGPLDKKVKGYLLDSLLKRYELEGESRTLFDIVARTAASLAAVFEKERTALLLPEIGG